MAEVQMTDSPRSGGELCIVDNSDESWKGLRYLQDWTEIASAFEIATGFFAMQQGKTQCRVYARRKFHAKAYITYPSLRFKKLGGYEHVWSVRINEQYRALAERTI